ncbi:hypothetical protein [Mycolicibacter longobardus]|uniref:Uncharacterized protein n=1 Tax=Mycolicibacter longobardus TaxID=1108812 RepID=A0A1X1YEC0_9MYCO|nr:hypothetical protein [Mycolicibacter longobardus]ORW09426.1 hypothetical protein AWC16_16555 [Mycolicibacter longobardus]
MFGRFSIRGGDFFDRFGHRLGRILCDEAVNFLVVSVDDARQVLTEFIDGIRDAFASDTFATAVLSGVRQTVVADPQAHQLVFRGVPAVSRSETVCESLEFHGLVLFGCRVARPVLDALLGFGWRAWPPSPH